MSDSLNICLPCGLCCNGTLIGFVELNQEEIPVLNKLMDIEISSKNGVFIQPCNNYSDCNGCEIYSQRPKQCDSYKCELLKSVENKETSFDSAIEIIDIIKEQKVIIEKQLSIEKIELKSPSFYFKMVELKKILNKQNSELSITQNQYELLSNLNQLDNLISTKMGLSFN